MSNLSLQSESAFNFFDPDDIVVRGINRSLDDGDQEKMPVQIMPDQLEENSIENVR